MEVIRVINPEKLDPEARELWDHTFPDGFWASAPENEAPQVRLWSFGYICMLELGRIPEPVAEAVDPELGPMLWEYVRRMRAKRGST